MREWYRRLPAAVRVLMQVVLLFAGVAVGISLLLYPKIRRLAASQPEVASLLWKVDAGLRQMTDYTPPTDVERQAWGASRSQLLAKLPPDEDLPKLLEALTLLAGRNRVGDLVVSTSPRVPLKTDAASPLIGEAALAKAQPDLGVELGYYPIAVSFQAGYRDLARFLEGVERLSPLVSVASLEVRRGVPHVGVQMVLRAYHSGSRRNGSR
jgi:Tfp pilus assembly protein PilO